MKAVVVLKKGESPQYLSDFPEQDKQSTNEVLMKVKAVAIKNLDKIRASGNHYSLSFDDGKPKIVGTDGIGLLEDGSLVYGYANNGILAEKAWVNKESIVPLPKALDAKMASALPNAVMGSALALLHRAKLKSNETVLVNGATGVTGKLAVQLAKIYGAKTVIATGRNSEALKELLNIGADQTINLKDETNSILAQLKEVHSKSPIDVVLDYLWGQPAETILNALKSKGTYTHKTRYVTIGDMAGKEINLPSGILRSTDIELLGSGLGTWTDEEMKLFYSEILPNVFQLASTGKLRIDTFAIPIEETEEYWNKKIENNNRLIVYL